MPAETRLPNVTLAYEDCDKARGTIAVATQATAITQNHLQIDRILRGGAVRSVVNVVIGVLALKIENVSWPMPAESGELGALLRREEIYSSHLRSWRRQLAAQAESALQSPSGEREPLTDEKDRQIENLQREKVELKERLRLAESLLELERKALVLIEQVNTLKSS